MVVLIIAFIVLIAIVIYLIYLYRVFDLFFPAAPEKILPNIEKLIADNAILKSEYNKNVGMVEVLKKELILKDQELAKLFNQKKSSEVKTGHIVEQLAPFLEGFPYNPKDCRPILQPIDYVVFDENGIHFVEVKSGDASLTTSQRKIRDQIANKQIDFKIFRIK